MKNKLFSALAFGVLLSLTACFGQHNQAPSKGKNLDDTRVYGNQGGEPKQLNLRDTYDQGDDTLKAMQVRANDIREKLYPK